jgi:hypothetical protein
MAFFVLRIKHKSPFPFDQNFTDHIKYYAKIAFDRISTVRSILIIYYILRIDIAILRTVHSHNKELYQKNSVTTNVVLSFDYVSNLFITSMFTLYIHRSRERENTLLAEENIQCW